MSIQAICWSLLTTIVAFGFGCGYRYSDPRRSDAWDTEGASSRCQSPDWWDELNNRCTPPTAEELCMRDSPDSVGCFAFTQTVKHDVVLVTGGPITKLRSHSGRLLPMGRAELGRVLRHNAAIGVEHKSLADAIRHATRLEKYVTDPMQKELLRRYQRALQEIGHVTEIRLFYEGSTRANTRKVIYRWVLGRVRRSKSAPATWSAFRQSLPEELQLAGGNVDDMIQILKKEFKTPQGLFDYLRGLQY